MDNINQSEEKVISTMDTLGILASSLCLIHCLAMPFLISMLPALNIPFLQGEESHYILCFAVVLFLATGLVPGYLKHKDKRILALALLGISMVIFAVFAAPQLFGHQWETPIISAGNIMLVIAHAINRKVCRHNHSTKSASPENSCCAHEHIHI